MFSVVPGCKSTQLAHRWPPELGSSSGTPAFIGRSGLTAPPAPTARWGVLHLIVPTHATSLSLEARISERSAPQSPSGHGTRRPGSWNATPLSGFRPLYRWPAAHLSKGRAASWRVRAFAARRRNRSSSSSEHRETPPKSATSPHDHPMARKAGPCGPTTPRCGTTPPARTALARVAAPT